MTVWSESEIGGVIEDILVRRVTMFDPARRSRTAPLNHAALSPTVAEIDLSADVAASRLRDLPGLIFLDSSQPGGEMGAYSYVTADPFLLLSSRGRRVEISSRAAQSSLDADPWRVLQPLLARYRMAEMPGPDCRRSREALPDTLATISVVIWSAFRRWLTRIARARIFGLASTIGC